jgi:uroporphyrinogen-III synthase
VGGERPLAGRRILVTRRPEQAGSLVEGLQQRGAEVVLVPLIAVVAPEEPGPLDQALAQLARYDWLVFTSANTVEAVRDRLEARGLPVALPQAARIAVVGPSTAAALEAQFPGAAVALQPASQFRAEGLLEAFAGTDLSGLRILLPLSDRARDTLAQGLRRSGALVDAPIAYRTLSADSARDALEKALAEGLDFVTLASPSAVDAFVAAAGGHGSAVAAAVMGPITERAAREAGLDVRVVASPATVEGLLTALVQAAGQPSP